MPLIDNRGAAPKATATLHSGLIDNRPVASSTQRTVQSDQNQTPTQKPSLLQRVGSFAKNQASFAIHNPAQAVTNLTGNAGTAENLSTLLSQPSINRSNEQLAQNNQRAIISLLTKLKATTDPQKKLSIANAIKTIQANSTQAANENAANPTLNKTKLQVIGDTAQSVLGLYPFAAGAKSAAGVAGREAATGFLPRAAQIAKEALIAGAKQAPLGAVFGAAGAASQGATKAKEFAKGAGLGAAQFAAMGTAGHLTGTAVKAIGSKFTNKPPVTPVPKPVETPKEKTFKVSTEASKFDQQRTAAKQNYSVIGKTDIMGKQPENAGQRILEAQATTPQGKAAAKIELDSQIKSGAIKPNKDGTITVYRGGEPNAQAKLVSVSTDKTLAAEHGPVTSFKVKPEDIAVAKGLDPKELLVNKEGLTPPKPPTKVPGGEKPTPSILTTGNGMKVEISNLRPKTINVPVGDKSIPIEAKIFEHDGVTLALYNEKPLGGSHLYVLADPKTGATISSGQSEAGAILHATLDDPAYWNKVKAHLSNKQPSLDRLLAEARKYKSAEEFVNNSPNLDKLVFGFQEGDKVKLSPNQIKIMHPDEIVQATERASKIKDVSKLPPIDVNYDAKTGEYQLQDGHARYLAAKRQGVPLEATVQTIFNPNKASIEKKLGMSLTDLYNQAHSLPSNKPVEAVKPVETALKPSKVAASIDAKAIEKGLTKGFKDIAGYEPITIKDQAARAAKVMTDMDKATKMVMGETPLAKGLKAEMLVKAMEDHAVANGNSELLRKLASSPLVSETSGHAQALRLLAERDPNSPLTVMRDLSNERIKAAGGEKVVKAAVAKTTSQIKAEINRNLPTKADWGSFLDNIACK